MHYPHRRSRALMVALATSVICGAPALAQPLAIVETPFYPSIFREVLPADRAPERALPRYETTTPAEERAIDLPAHLRRQIVNYPTREAPGTIVVDTANTYLYLVLEGGRAMRYGIGVGREGFTWAGVETVARKTEWPDWHPPADMIARQPYLPRFMAGGPGNPLGARAMYLGNSLFRIHGTNAPSTIGQRVSSGCIRLTNEDVQDLYDRVAVGARVVVLNDGRRAPADVASVPAPAPRHAAPRPDTRRYETPRYDAPRYEAPRYEAPRIEGPLVYAPRPPAVVPLYDERPYRSANPYYGASSSRIY